LVEAGGRRHPAGGKAQLEALRGHLRRGQPRLVEQRQLEAAGDGRHLAERGEDPRGEPRGPPGLELRKHPQGLGCLRQHAPAETLNGNVTAGINRAKSVMAMPGATSRAGNPTKARRSTSRSCGLGSACCALCAASSVSAMPWGKDVGELYPSAIPKPCGE